MSQPDPTKETKTPWTAGSIALLVIGVLVMVASGLCSASFGLPILFSPYGALVLIFGGIPFLVGAALVDAARYYRRTSSGRFGRIVLLVCGVLVLLYGVVLTYLEWAEPGGQGLFAVTRLQAGLAGIVIATALLIIALRIRRRNRADD